MFGSATSRFGRKFRVNARSADPTTAILLDLRDLTEELIANAQATNSLLAAAYHIADPTPRVE